MKVQKKGGAGFVFDQRIKREIEIGTISFNLHLKIKFIGFLFINAL